MADRDELARWEHTAAPGPEAEAAALLGALRSSPAPRPRTLAELQERRRRRRSSPMRPRLQLQRAAAGLALVAAAAAASYYVSHPRSSAVALAPTGPARAASTAHEAASPAEPTPRDAAPVAPSPPVASLAPPAVRVVSRPKLAARVPPVAPPVAPPPDAMPGETGATPQEPPGPTPLQEESQQLAMALDLLHRTGQPQAALDVLDALRARFPNGHLANEAQLVRVEAELELGRRERALAELVAVPDLALRSSLRGPELRALRGELLSDANRCAEALVDFEAVLQSSSSAPARQRALYGRALCRATEGDEGGSRRDLERYLELFPDGRFSAPARKALGR